MNNKNQNILLKLNTFIIIFFAVFSIFFTACSTGSKFEPKSAEEAFNEGFRMFEKKKYIDAMSYFDMIKLQYPASNFADKAQFYIAEINFARKEYILASFNYSRVRTLYPGSEFAKIALYKAGYSQFLLSPDYHKDQEYTKRAIKTLQDYQFYYAEKDSLYEETSKMILQLRDVLGEKEYETAQLYRKLESPRSALIYYDAVINEYDDTKYFEAAWFGKIEALFLMRREEEGKNAVMNYQKLFPNGEYSAQINEIVNSYEKSESELSKN
jgi:outer membrane protein assembly factor BamD